MVVCGSLNVFYGSLMTLALGIATCLAALWVLAVIIPAKRARWRRIPRPLYVLGIALTILLIFLIGTRSFALMEYLGISVAYGGDAYADGLRLVDKHGNLNDGTVLPDLWRVLVYTGVYILQMWSSLLIVVFYFLFSAERERRLLQPRQPKGTLTPAAVDSAGRQPDTENGTPLGPPCN
jgi:hypothetical protein